MNTIIDDARRFAIEMHDKFKHQRSNGEAYWHHPERVVATLQSHGVEDRVRLGRLDGRPCPTTRSCAGCWR